MTDTVTAPSKLEGLYPHQIAAYPAFKRWMDSSKPFAHLQGVGGSGKTYTIIRWCQEYGLSPDQIIGVAPTNVAARQLAISTGLECATFHKAFKLKPKEAEWTSDHDQNFEKLQSDEQTLSDRIDNEDGDVQALLKEHKQVQRLLGELEAYRRQCRDRETTFIFDSDSSPIGPDIRLILVDECSMLNQANVRIIETCLQTLTLQKVLYLGDIFQCFAVGESEPSLSFATPCIAEFNEIVRAGKGSAIAKISMALRDCAFNEAISLLQSLPESDGNFAETEPGSALQVDLRQSKELVKYWASTLEPNGVDYRVICYRRAKVYSRSNAIKKFVGTPWMGQGDHLIGQSQVSRTMLLEDEQGRSNFVPNVPILVNSDFCRIRWEHGYTLHSIDTPWGTEEFKIKVVEVNPTVDLPGIVKLAGTPGETWREKQVWVSNPYTLRIIHPQDMERYQLTLKFWKDARAAFYGKGNKPEDGDRAKSFLNYIGRSKWNEVQGTPGHPYKEPVGTCPYLQPDIQGIEAYAKGVPIGNMKPKGKSSEFQYWRDAVTKRYYWLESLCDDVIYPLSTTVHKSQGSTIRNVLIDLPDIYAVARFTDKASLCRVLYTAVSRASERLYIYC